MIARSLLALVTISALVAPAFADPPPPDAGSGAAPSPMQEAGQHFTRGVALYDEADYRAALIEFRRAYEIAPNAVVLYNIGEAYYQLQNYANALTALERYLAESGAAAEHRAEVTKTIELLKSRVGKIQITTNVPGCEITVDDEFIGTTPLPGPMPISVGHRKITAMRTGLPPETRFVDVAAGDTAVAVMTLAKATVTAPVIDAKVLQREDDESHHAWVVGGWVATGILGAGGIAMGVLAYKESSDLSDLRNKFGVTKSELDDKSSKVKTFSAIGDIAGGLAIITGAISLKLTLSQSSTHEVHAQITSNAVSIGGRF